MQRMMLTASAQACNRQSVYCVPLYDTLGENAIEYIISHSESTIVFTSALNFPKLAQALPKVKEQLKTVVYWGKADSANEQVSIAFHSCFQAAKGTPAEAPYARFSKFKSYLNCQRAEMPGGGSGGVHL